MTADRRAGSLWLVLSLAVTAALASGCGVEAARPEDRTATVEVLASALPGGTNVAWFTVEGDALVGQAMGRPGQAQLYADGHVEATVTLAAVPEGNNTVRVWGLKALDTANNQKSEFRLTAMGSTDITVFGHSSTSAILSANAVGSDLFYANDRFLLNPDYVFDANGANAG